LPSTALPRLSVNIPTWRRKERLQELLMALTKQEGVSASEFEVLVCDSGSGDGTQELVHAFAEHATTFRFLDIVTNTLSAKRNALAHASRAPLLLLLDDDCIPDPGLVSTHLALHERREGVVGCGAIRYPAPWVASSNYFRFRDSRHIGPERPDIDMERVPGRNWTVMNLSVRTTDVARLGLMDEGFVHYGGEDHEFAERWERGGVVGIFLPAALVWHHEWGGSVDQFERKQYFLSRYGMPLLLRESPQFLRESAFRFLEPPQRGSGLLERLRDVGIRLITSRLWTSAVRKWLKATDRCPRLYAPALFRYVAAGAYARGARDRSKPIAEGWF